jgi:hypothetical protein
MPKVVATYLLSPWNLMKRLMCWKVSVITNMLCEQNAFIVIVVS